MLNLTTGSEIESTGKCSATQNIRVGAEVVSILGISSCKNVCTCLEIGRNDGLTRGAFTIMIKGN